MVIISILLGAASSRGCILWNIMYTFCSNNYLSKSICPLLCDHWYVTMSIPLMGKWGTPFNIRVHASGHHILLLVLGALSSRGLLFYNITVYQAWTSISSSLSLVSSSRSDPSISEFIWSSSPCSSVLPDPSPLSSPEGDSYKRGNQNQTVSDSFYKKLKADRLHPRDYTYTPTDYRHTDKHLRLEMGILTSG